jgi:hypothetical protein
MGPCLPLRVRNSSMTNSTLSRRNAKTSPGNGAGTSLPCEVTVTGFAAMYRSSEHQELVVAPLPYLAIACAEHIANVTPTIFRFFPKELRLDIRIRCVGRLATSCVRAHATGQSNLGPKNHGPSHIKRLSRTIDRSCYRSKVFSKRFFLKLRCRVNVSSDSSVRMGC